MDIFLNWINLANWLDLIWVPLAFFVLHKGQRFRGVMFVLSCVLALRLQVELFQEIKYPNGILNFIDYPLLTRGFIIYGVFIAIFLLLSHFSREKDPYVFIAAAITVFFAAFTVSTFVLVL